MSRPIAICIGLNRTGLTSLGQAVQILGFSGLGWTDQSDGLIRAWLEGDLETLRSVASRHQVLGDFPWPLVYRDLADTFPGAKFVLTRRSSVETWLGSQIDHTTRRVPGYWGHEAIYGDASAKAAPALYRRTYERHLSGVREFFGSSHRLLEVCWEEGDGWAEICAFLGVPVPRDVAFPHASARSRKRRLRDGDPPAR